MEQLNLFDGAALREVAALEREPAKLGVHCDEDGVYVQGYVPCFYTWEEWDDLICQVEWGRLLA